MIAKIYNILILGVGGQGVMTLGKIIQEYGMLDPEITDVIASESRGVSQREGSVYSNIKFVYGTDPEGKNPVLSFNPPQGDVDLVLGLEPLEFYRNLHYLKQGSKVILNTHQILPKSLQLSNQQGSDIRYPDIEKSLSLIKKYYPKIELIAQNYTKKALKDTGKSINANKLILSELPGHCPQIFKEKIFQKLIHDFFPG